MGGIVMKEFLLDLSRDLFHFTDLELVGDYSPYRFLLVCTIGLLFISYLLKKIISFCSIRQYNIFLMYFFASISMLLLAVILALYLAEVTVIKLGIRLIFLYGMSLTLGSFIYKIFKRMGRNIVS